jgi:predicted secreted protein
MRPLVLIAAILLLPGSGPVTANPRGSASVQIDEAAAGRRTEVAVGDSLQITLVETLSTGYAWQIVRSCADLLELQSNEAISPGDAPPGSPGKHRWSFLVKARGTCELRFESARSWEQKATGKTLIFPIAVAAK